MRMQSVLSNLRMRNKLIIMLVLPISAMIILLANRIMDDYGVIRDISIFKDLAEFEERSDAVLIPFQTERGLSIEYVKSNGKAFTSELMATRAETDKAIIDFSTYIKNFDSKKYGPEFANRLDGALATLDQMRDIRNKVDKIEMTAYQTDEYYGGYSIAILKVVAQIPVVVSNKGLSMRFSAMSSLMFSMELMIQERSLLLNAFERNGFEKEEYSTWQGLMSAQKIYIGAFLEFSPAAIRDFYRAALSNPSIAEVDRMRRIAQSRHELMSEDDWGVIPKHWFENITQVYEIYGQVEEQLPVSMHALAAESESAATKSIWTFLVSTGAFSIFSIMLALYIAFNTSNRLKKLGDKMQDLSSGEGDLTKRLEIDSKDEIGEIAGYFNCFINKLHNSISIISHHTETVSSFSLQLAATSTKIAANAEETSTQSEIVSLSAKKATNSISTISSATEVICSSSNSAASSIEEMSASLKEVSKNCQIELKIVTEANLNVRGSKEIMGRLGAAAKSIGKVTEVINDIADRTNLLALNAAIEAASAGEVGKGFAIVANEVKALAKQTAQATQEIEKQIEDVQNSAGFAIKAIDRITEIIEEVNAISQAIVSAVEEQSSTVNEISKNVGQLSVGIQKVACNVTQSAQGMTEVSRVIVGVSSASADTAKGIAQCNSSVRELSKLSVDLKELLSQFKI